MLLLWCSDALKLGMSLNPTDLKGLGLSIAFTVRRPEIEVKYERTLDNELA
jgi:hypothetical protein